MNTNRMKALFKREIQDIFRDKKTLFMMVVLPLILYPLLIVVMTLIMNAVMSGQAEKTYTIGFVESDQQIFDEMKNIFAKEEEEIGYRCEAVRASEKELKNQLTEEKIDAYVKADGTSYELCYLSAKNDSQTAVSALKSAFDLYRERLREENIEKAGLDKDTILNPISYTNEDLSTTEESLGNIIGSIIPFLIITSILLGAIYPAIDVTAGEKERGTLETLLTLPVTNFEMIMSKFLAVSVISCVSAFLNVFSMGAAMIFLVASSLSSMANMNITINYGTFIPGILFTLLVMIFFALLVTAVCMCTCVFAKSFKEANNYITPVMLIFMFGSYATMLPDLELSTQTAAIPVVNVALMIKGLFQFSYDYGLFAIVLFSNVAYSLLAVLILAKIYNSEAVLFSEGFGSLKLFDKRSEMKEKQMPGYGDVILLLSVVALLIFYIGSYAQIKLGFGGVAVQQSIILLLPFIYAWYMKADYKKLFSLRKPRVKQLAGSILLGISAFLAALIIGGILAPIFPDSAESLTLLDEWFKTVPTFWLIVVAAVMPAVGEELLFRGFVLGTLKNKTKAWIAVLVTTLIFAAYHMSLVKMFTIGIVGFAFTYAAFKSRSIFCSMCMHFLNNLFSVALTKYPKQIGGVLPFLLKESLSVSDVCLILAVVVFAGFLGWRLLKETS